MKRACQAEFAQSLYAYATLTASDDPPPLRLRRGVVDRQEQPAPDARGRHADRARALRARACWPCSSRNLSRLSTAEADPIAVVVTLAPDDRRPRAREPGGPGLPSPDGAHRGQRGRAGAVPASLSGPGRGARRSSRRRPSRRRSRSCCVPARPRGRPPRSPPGARLWPGVESAESGEEFERRFRDAVSADAQRRPLPGRRPDHRRDPDGRLGGAPRARPPPRRGRHHAAHGRDRGRDPRAVLAVRHGRGRARGDRSRWAFSTARIGWPCIGWRRTRTRSCRFSGSASSASLRRFCCPRPAPRRVSSAACCRLGRSTRRRVTRIA